jgi:hypothetical protein
MTTIEEAKQYFLERCREIILMSDTEGPWIFVCCSALIDYLVQMTTGQSGRVTYISFVDNYFKEVNFKYKEFEYAGMQKDLATQIYVVLRCGVVHKFSFVPRAQEPANVRGNSMLLAHEKNGHVGRHLTPYATGGMQGAVFTAELFAKDIKAVVEFIFKKAATDLTLETNIKTFIATDPPILGRFN